MYFALAQIWGWPHAEQVMGSIAAVNVFVGVVLAVASKIWNNSDAKYDGVIDVHDPEDGGPKKADLILKNYEDPADVVRQKEVLFKVNHK